MLKRGVDVVVATPGRALDHIRRKTLRLDAVKIVVLDEADEMLDMGFAEDLEAILEATPAERQTALFSATLPPRIAEIAKQASASDPVRVRIDREVAAGGLRAARAPGGVHRRRAPQDRDARPRARRRESHVGDRVLPHAHRGGRAHRDAQRARLPRRGAARRLEPGAARPRDEAVPREHGGPARRHRRRRARARRRSTSRTS